MRSVVGEAGAVVTLLVVVSIAPLPVTAQQARGWVSSSAQLVGLRPLEKLADPCPIDEACYAARVRELAAISSQDLFLTAWGFGLTGFSTTVQLRARQDLGGSFAWPRADDAFDVLQAYGELVRGEVTVRAGRQEMRTGLGFPSFDGGLVRWSRRAVRVEAYGGRSLARGLREPANEALRGLEDFLPDQSVVLMGVSARARVAAMALTARYHREILADRSGLASERASLDLNAATTAGVVRGALDYDFGRGIVGKGHITVGRPFGQARGIVELSASRYVPYFSLSTIWGFFEPVSYTEGTVRVGWVPADGWALRTSLGLRRYGDPGTAVILRPLEDTGRRGSLDAAWAPSTAWSLGATYDLEWGPGGYLSSLDGRVAWAPGEATHVTVSVRTFQQIEQYRLGDGRALGGGVSAGTAVTDRVSVAGGLSVLRHRSSGGAVDSPWSQARGWTQLRLSLGSDPGSGATRGGPR